MLETLELSLQCIAILLTNPGTIYPYLLNASDLKVEVISDCEWHWMEMDSSIGPLLTLNGVQID